MHIIVFFHRIQLLFIFFVTFLPLRASYCSFIKTHKPTCTGLRTETFSKKSPKSVIFRSEIAVICHKNTIKCRWNHGETFTAKIYKLGPKCRWQHRGENHTCIHVHVTALHVFFCCLVLFFYYFVLYISIWYRFFFRDAIMAYILFIGYMRLSTHLVLRILSNHLCSSPTTCI